MALGLQCKYKPLAPDPHLPPELGTFISPMLCLPTRVTELTSPCQQHCWPSLPSCSPVWANQCYEERSKTVPPAAPRITFLQLTPQSHHPGPHPGLQREAEARGSATRHRPFLCGATRPFFAGHQERFSGLHQPSPGELRLKCPHP